MILGKRAAGQLISHRARTQSAIPYPTRARYITAMAQNGNAHPEVTGEPLLLYNWLCPYVQRVTLALAHKQINARRIAIDLQNKPEWLTTYSPLGKVPAVTYIEGGKQQVLYESLALVHWVNEYYADKGHDLLPGTPAQKTKARIIIARFDNNGAPALAKLLRAADKEEYAAALNTWHTELSWLEENIDQQGPFLFGAQPTLVDAVIAPWLLRVPVHKHYRNVELLEGHPKLQAYVEKYKSLPEVQDNFETLEGTKSYDLWLQGLIKGYGKYAGEVKDWSSVAKL